MDIDGSVRYIYIYTPERNQGGERDETSWSPGQTEAKIRTQGLGK